MTLVCGHNICKACFSEHSDIKSKDSLVFCEDCKVSTKNKNLKELKTIRNICSSYMEIRKALNELKNNVGITDITSINNSEGCKKKRKWLN